MDIGGKIKMLREEKQMTLEELGNKVGVGKSTVRKWEIGMIANMRRDKINKIADALSTTPAFLMGWKEPAPSSADILADIAMDPQLLEYVMKIKEMTEAQKNEVYSYIDYICHKNK